jgi:hypothetical protein
MSNAVAVASTPLAPGVGANEILIVISGIICPSPLEYHTFDACGCAEKGAEALGAAVP